MRTLEWFIALVSLVPALAACGGNSAGGDGGAAGGTTTTTAAECNMIDDSFGPGRYSDTCTKREWAEPYVGTYTSSNCKLTISTPSGGPPAVFELVVSGAMLAGTYTHDWEGGTGAGNDSYYVMTTDATFATTKAIAFGVGRKVSDTEERSIGFRVNGLDTGTTSYTGYFGKTITSPFSNEEVDCGALMPAP